MQISDIMNLVLACCKPRRVILFKEKVTVGSHDLKSASLCIILDTCDKKRLLSELYLKVNVPIPVHFLLYQTEEWIKLLGDTGSYASEIHRKGTVLYGETP